MSLTDGDDPRSYVDVWLMMFGNEYRLNLNSYFQDTKNGSINENHLWSTSSAIVRAQ